MRKLPILVAASLAVAVPTVASATTTAGADMETPVRDDDDDFPWGLLGLIGLAGLFGRKREDRHVHTDTVHTNNRI